jgi:uncharacterized MAPEG superfamily protein
MTTELWLLFSSLPVYGLYLGAQSILYRWHHGLWFAQTARDDEGPPSPILGRAERALRNFLETWPASTILLLIAHLAHRGDALVFWGAIVWLVSRVAYLPLYIGGVFGIRSLVWFIGALGLFAMFVGILF